MKYTVTINEKSKTVVVNLNGYEGVAKCCETDTFNLQTGIELALERAKVAQTNKHKPTTPTSVMELVKALEKALPKGQMVIVGNGKEMTAEQKKWLANLAGVSAKHCCCPCCDCDNDDDSYDEGYNDGYADGYAEAEAICEENSENEEALDRIRSVLEDVGII